MSEIELYISASRTPGQFGATVFNELFRRHNISALYEPKKFENAAVLMQLLRTRPVQGCGVSHPLKRDVVPHLDELDEVARKLNSVNTICRMGTNLKGYNTDWLGAKLALLPHAFSSVRILGAGGVVPALLYALEQRSISDIEIVCRDKTKAEEFQNSAQICSFNEKPSKKDLLINALPLLATDNNSTLDGYISFSNTVFDLSVATSPTAYVREARKQHKVVIEGYEMAVYQLIEQFRIYRRQNLPAEEVFSIVRELYLTK